MAHPVIPIAGEVLGGELPVAGNDPLVDPADHLGTALAAVPGVEEKVQVELVPTQIVEKGRG